jgi:putative DNA methylase
MKSVKKLIEISMPLEAINKASSREKSIRQGHPSTLHIWWARRPLAAARAVLFAQTVDDPSAYPDLFPTEKAQEKERQRLFRIIEELVTWENTTNERVLQAARDEIWQSWRRTCAANVGDPRAKELFDRYKLPAFHDPFAGGGTLPLEAQRLGFECYATDLNPVAVLINTAMIAIPPRFANKAPVNPAAQKQKSLLRKTWNGTAGLAEDVKFYGQWMRSEAEQRIGRFYPQVDVTPEMAKRRPDLAPLVGQKLTVIVWLWARTVRSPNPAFAKVDVPLVSTFILSRKPGREAFIEPVIDGDKYQFVVKLGKPKRPQDFEDGTKLARGANFRCLLSNTPIDSAYIYSEAKAGRMGSRMIAVIAEHKNGRVYLSPSPEYAEIALSANPSWKPDLLMPENPRWFSPPLYGLKTFGDVFTQRQLLALTTFADLVQEARERIKHDAIDVKMEDDGRGFESGAAGASAYADAVSAYLALGVGRSANYWSSLTPWGGDFIVQTFGRQAIPMVWDYAEGNPFSDSTGNWGGAIDWITKVIVAALPGLVQGTAKQTDAQTQTVSQDKIISTDPPYYDNIGYADLSDFFYVWLRRSLKSIFPGLFETVAVPKTEELVATPYRHGGKDKAEAFFLQGMTEAMRRLAHETHPAFPVTIYYAFKQAESQEQSGIASTGWDTFLSAVIQAGFAVTGTWPMRTERDQGLKTGINVLASSVILVCRPRASDAPITTRRDFITTLKAELPIGLAHLQRANIAPVDLAQAAIGPGMAVYTRYSQVFDASGKSLSVRQALALINETLDEVLAEQEGDFDADSRWALAWFDQFGFADGEFGSAEILSKAKNTSIAAMEGAGILRSRAGKVRLLRPEELSKVWDGTRHARPSVWETVHQLIKTLGEAGEIAAGKLVFVLGSRAEVARELAYRLYTICERKKRSQEALSYNGLVQSWPEILRIAQESGSIPEKQAQMFDQE